MEIVYKKVKELKLNEKNPRKNDNAVDVVVKSIEKYGFKNPLVIDENNVVWCGNTRLKASRKMGLKEVPCIVADDLSPEKLREYALIDNKSNEVASWDLGLLEQELEELDLSDFVLDWGIKDKQENVKGEVPFTEIMNEESNYIVLQFKTDIDWLQAVSLFGITDKQAYSTRKDGKITPKMHRVGVGRVLDGAEVMNKIMGLK